MLSMLEFDLKRTQKPKAQTQFFPGDENNGHVFRIKSGSGNVVIVSERVSEQHYIWLA